MKIVLQNGDETEMDVSSAILAGYRAKSFTLNQDDIRRLCALGDEALVAAIRQLNGRVNRIGNRT